jgi:hypothetical protein
MIVGVGEREFCDHAIELFHGCSSMNYLRTVRLRLRQEQLSFKLSMKHKSLISLQVTRGKRAYIFHVFHVFFSLLWTSLYTVNNHVLKDNVICFSHKKNMQTDHKIYVNSHYAAKQ